MIDTTLIKEGMTVYDEHENKVGSVGYVQYTDEDYNKLGPETISPSTDVKHANTEGFSFFKAFAEAFTSEDDMPEEVRQYLEHHGYFRLKTGNPFESDYYVSMNNVSAIVGQNLHLKTNKDELLSV